jgi:hypothetical protein
MHAWRVTVADDPVVTRCQEMWEGTQRRLGDWQRSTPKATFAEIEDAVEEEVARFRARLIADLVSARASKELPAEDEQPHCPECGRVMKHRGERERAVTVRGNHTVRFCRGYVHCPACGAGLFPPR